MKVRQVFISGMLMLFVGMQAFAKGPCPEAGCHAKKGEKQHRMWQELGLTEQQQTQIKELHDAMTQTRKEHWTKTREVRNRIREELAKENPDKAALDQYAEQSGELAKQISQQRSNHLLEIKNVLTPEQFQKMIERKDSFRHGRKHKGKRGCGTKGSVQ